jgi:serine/threonine protein kinase
MEDYEMITRLGGGSFADVYKAKEKLTGNYVAIKVLKKKYKKWEDCVELRECKSLQVLNKPEIYEKGQENIIKLKEIIFNQKTGELNLIFEFMEKDLFNLMKSYEPKCLPETKIKDIIYQALLGLSFMHKYGFFHRDIKPENLLLVNDKVKIADFGLAREIRSIPPYTEYVSTRYYRAPECILKSTNYNSPIDIWALGCVMAEMYLHPQPLFYGANEKEVLYRICSVLGTPTYDIWSDGIQQANLLGFKFPNSSKTDLEDIILDASPEAIDLMKKMLQWDPIKRETASNLLNHKFFDSYRLYNDYISNDYSKIDFNLNNSKFYYDNNKSNINENKDNNFSLSNNNFDEKDKNRNMENYEITENISMINKDNKETEENNFSKILNDTEGFNKLINQLKEQQIEDDKIIEKEKNNNNLFLSIEKKLNISITDSKSNKQKDKYQYNPSDTNKTKPFDFLDELNLDKNNDKIDEYKKNDVKVKETNNFDNDNLVNLDNNDEFGFDNMVRIKPIIKNNRRGSAKKFLEENENKYNLKNKVNQDMNLNNNEQEKFVKPIIHKNEFTFVDNLNGIFNGNKNKFEINDFNGLNRRRHNIKKNIALSDSNEEPFAYLNNKNSDKGMDSNNSNLKRRRINYPNNNDNWNI